MKVQYKRLWKLLIDKDLTKRDLARLAHVSGGTLTKMSRGENVSVDILMRICEALDCGLEDIIEFLPDREISGN